MSDFTRGRLPSGLSAIKPGDKVTFEHEPDTDNQMEN